jgi:hypothetical protein
LPDGASDVSSNKTSNTLALMPDFLTRRNGSWHSARRVPTEFAHLDRRGVVKHSTKIRIASDRAAVRASRVAEKFNSSLKQHWRMLADNDSRRGGVCARRGASASRKRWLSSYLSRLSSCVIKPFDGQRSTRAANVVERRVVVVAVPMVT